MLTYHDCADFADLSEDAIAAIAVHEHVPDIVAAQLASGLLRSQDGVRLIECYIRDDAVSAQRRGRAQDARHWRSVLSEFLVTHP